MDALRRYLEIWLAYLWWHGLASSHSKNESSEITCARIDIVLKWVHDKLGHFDPILNIIMESLSLKKLRSDEKEPYEYMGQKW